MDPLTRFHNACETLQEFETEYLLIPETEHREYTLATHLDELKVVWHDIKGYYTGAIEYLLSTPASAAEKATSSEEVTAVKSEYRRCYQLYVRFANRIYERQRALVQVLTPVTPPAPAPPVAIEHRTRQHLTLPPCDTDVFHGDYKSWPSFRDMFSAIYIRNGRLAPVEKLFHLLQKTQGEAKEIVQKSPLTDAGFDEAWQNLSERFENKRILVNTQLRILFNLRHVSKESGTEIKALQREINNALSALQQFEIDTRSWDAIIVHLCTSRTTPAPRYHPRSVGTIINRQTRDPKWNELDTFLTQRFQTLETVDDIRRSSVAMRKTPQITERAPKPSKPVHMYQANVTSVTCKLFSGHQHVLRKCPRFLEKNIEQRIAFVKKQSLCLNCFAHSHVLKECKSSFNCASCNRRHNTLLHREAASASAATTQSKPSSLSSRPGSPTTRLSSELPTTSAQAIQNSTTHTHTAHIQSTTERLPKTANHNTLQQSQMLLATAMVHVQLHGDSFLARALIDPGSEATFLSERLQRRLHLPTRTIQAEVAGINKTVTALVNKFCSFQLGSPRIPLASIKVDALVLSKLTDNLPFCDIDRDRLNSLPDLPLADVNFHKSGHIDRLIGADVYPLTLLDGIQRNVLGSLLAQETIFGWILTGPIFPSQCPPRNTTRVSFFNEVALDRQLTQFWELEEVPQRKPLSPSEKYCEEHYTRTTRRLEDGRYIVSLPFKEDFPHQTKLGYSRDIAAKQFLRNEVKLLKTPDDKQLYDSVLREYLTLKHMVGISRPATTPFNKSDYYYLPHHAVLKPDSSTTKVRVVFNASCPTSNGVSLNDVLYPGPALQADLNLLLMKWRLFKYVFNGDIEKMYRQINVDPDQARYQRIIFRNSPEEEIQEFELRTVTFGVNCAPYLAIRTLHQLADEIRHKFPLASHVLTELMYVDDALAGAHDVETAIKTRHQLTAALATAGFRLRKWTANHHLLLKGIPSDDLLTKDFLEFEDTSTAKTLGIRWNAKLDIFQLAVEPMVKYESYTKRQVLSAIARIFDPAGWLAPVVIIAKTIMQNIWLDGTGWDEPLKPDTLVLWLAFADAYPQINQVRIPRWVQYTPESSIELHAFCDASERAYASCIYMRVITEQTITVSLLYARTKVAPVKTISVPRLELCGAVLLAEMLKVLLPNLDLSCFDLYCWTDSTIVLSWLKRPPCTWTTFVANRVAKIVEIIDPGRWFHVQSAENPADLATRGLLPSDLNVSSLWWNGPSWLSLPRKEWPFASTLVIEDTELEMKPIKAFATQYLPNEDILERFSALPKALRVLAYVFRFLDRTHSRSRATFERTSSLIETDEIQRVQTRLIHLAQRSHYPNECKSLDTNERLSSKSTILSLNPFRHDDGVLRVGGRLAKCPLLSFNERHPIILPYNAHFTKLLVRMIHQITLHGGNQLMLRLIRTQYWIPRAKNLVKTTIHQCKSCIIQRNQQRTQIMASLPPERVSISRPFAATGLDFTGPFEIKNYTGRACLITKGYVCIFVCFATKAIHLEAVSDLTTSAFLAAFSRFVARRGCPADLYSDNGTNFVGASKTLANDMKAFLKQSEQQINVHFAHQQIKWHFIPAGAPHMGGLWEAGVKSFKAHLKRQTNQHRFTFEEFSTILHRIEACLNSRPLSPMSEDPNDLQPLTPGHFLISGPLLAPAEPQILDQPIKILNRWQKVKAISQQFCRRWKTEYLSELHRRQKWKYPQKQVELNDLVVIREDNSPPNSWRLGRVTQVFRGSDNHVRVANIRTERGSITRPITKLVILPA